MRSIDDFLRHFRRQRQWTRALVAVIPEERFEWAPSATSFSCGGLVRHLMQAEVFWCRLAVRAARGERYDPFELSGSAEERLGEFRLQNLEASRSARYGESFSACLERWREIELRTTAELAAIGASDLQSVEAVHPLTCMRVPLWELLLVMLEHEAHHRGQLSAYLKMLRLEQPAAALWV